MRGPALEQLGLESSITRAGVFERIARRTFLAALAKLEVGEIIVDDAGEARAFGHTSGEFPHPVRLSVRGPSFWSRALRGGSIGAAESWMRGDWTCDDLPSLLRIVVRSRAAWDGLDAGLARLVEPLRRVAHALRRNTRAGARRNIAAHYDLGNDFFALFLDPTLTYSSGVFERPDASMEEASLAKYDRICRKLALRPDDHVLEIGSGWGGFAIFAASRYGCRVTTTTISPAQYELARERIAAAGLAERVTLLLQDYRDVPGRYDKLVSIEMIEAVGSDYFDAYFAACAERLEPGGAMALQAIVIGDREYERARREVDFIKRYIFPGGELPSLGAIASSLARASDLRISHLEDIASSYAETLRRWRRQLQENLGSIRRLGYAEPFLRMWDFYLAYCEAGFAERYLGCLQLVLAKPLYRGDTILGRL